MIKQIVKPMQRGQITLPQEIRDPLGITPDTYLWVKLSDTNQLTIEPVVDEPRANLDDAALLDTVTKNPSFDFLKDEPELYSATDGKPYEA